MLPRANIHDVATFVCLPDGRQRLQRYLSRRLGSSRSALSTAIRRLLVTGWFSTVAFVVIWISGFATLTLWAPMGPGKLDLHMRLSILIAWILTAPLFWIDVRLLRLRQLIGRRARMKGISIRHHGDEVSRRRSQWNQLLAGEDGAAVSGRMVGALPVGMLVAMLPFALISVPLVVWSSAGRAGDAARLVFPLGLLAIGFIRRHLEKRTAARFLEVSRLAACPECGYSLRAHLTHEEQTTGRIIGPARCPECGTHWPLVPPPCFVLPSHKKDWRRLGPIPQLLPPKLHEEGDADPASESSERNP